MKAISLWQPWASLWCSPAKVHETRHWPLAHRGWLAVHATKRVASVDDLNPYLEDIIVDAFGAHWVRDLPRGAIIGAVKVVACHRSEDVMAAFMVRPAPYADDYLCGDFSSGRFAFQRSEFRLLKEPVPWKGRQSKTFDIPDAVVAELFA